MKNPQEKFLRELTNWLNAVQNLEDDRLNSFGRDGKTLGFGVDNRGKNNTHYSAVTVKKRTSRIAGEN